MRSRYSAYVKGLWTYVVDTTHPLNPLLTSESAQAGESSLKDDVIATCDKLGFEVHRRGRSRRQPLLEYRWPRAVAAAAGPPGALAHKSNALTPLIPHSPLQKLKVLSTEPGADADEGFVTFQAWFKNVGQLGQRAQGFHTQTFVERSRFLRTEAGKWLYGERPAPGAAAKLVSCIGPAACGLCACVCPAVSSAQEPGFTIKPRSAAPSLQSAGSRTGSARAGPQCRNIGPVFLQYSCSSGTHIFSHELSVLYSLIFLAEPTPLC
jgi:uncharacterized protein YchJ